MKPCRKNSQQILAFNYLLKNRFIIDILQGPKCEYIDQS